MPGSASGTVTRRNVVHRLAPRVAAAASYSRSAERKAPSTAITTNGRDTKTCERTTPHVVNGKLKPVSSRIGSPSRPLRPNAVRSATPATTGGSTRGTDTSARSTPRWGRSTRASTQARGSPSTRQIRAARGRGRQRQPERLAQRLRAQLAGEAGPVDGRDHGHQRYDEQAGRDRCRDQQQRRWPAERVLHGAENPAASSAARPSSERTSSTQPVARSASPDCASGATW